MSVCVREKERERELVRKEEKIERGKDGEKKVYYIFWSHFSPCVYSNNVT